MWKTQYDEDQANKASSKKTKPEEFNVDQLIGDPLSGDELYLLDFVSEWEFSYCLGNAVVHICKAGIGPKDKYIENVKIAGKSLLMALKRQMLKAFPAPGQDFNPAALIQASKLNSNLSNAMACIIQSTNAPEQYVYLIRDAVMLIGEEISQYEAKVNDNDSE